MTTKQYLTITLVKITSPKNLHPLEGFWKSHILDDLEIRFQPVERRSHLKMLFRGHPYQHQGGCKGKLIVYTCVQNIMEW